MATITCADCGAERNARNKNTLYCHHCRLLRNAEHFAHPKRHRKCERCKTVYAPVDSSDQYCGEHELGYTALRGTCRSCGTEDAYLVRKGVAVCNSCARSPGLRRKLIDALRRGQAERCTANNHIQEED